MHPLDRDGGVGVVEGSGETIVDETLERVCAHVCSDQTLYTMDAHYLVLRTMYFCLFFTAFASDSFVFSKRYFTTCGTVALTQACTVTAFNYSINLA